ncbi:hypothetical protein T440DRAFT_493086 [Plenodomus tracheiphilus IPT5]|uniref:Uncharacterized protein n=1 Tax=Plenodomus tracheiphilus IPT5 TaxID=1408161 RepID=A0A6A7ARY1_9PLEO|nr:hypothetical protein T440DRAFT_493086 [Plenodomus tracheiphilus IPT5]
MGRYADMDGDLQRLPEGFQRIGYDADTSVYTFSGPDGKTYESEPGNRFGKLWPVGEPRPQRSDADIEAANAAIDEDNESALRTMLPFALLILVFMILVFKLAVMRFKSVRARPVRQRSRRDSVESFLKPEKGRVDSFVQVEKNKEYD